MLKIRAQYMTQLEEAMMNDFFDRMVLHVQSYFPDRDPNFDGRTTRERILAATADASRYGMSSESELCFFITLTFIFGHGFTRSREFSWFTDTLCGRPDSSASERIQLTADLIEKKFREFSSIHNDGDGSDAA